MSTRRVHRALAGLLAGRVGKDVVSRAWQRTRAAFEARQKRDLAGEGIARLILDGTVVEARLDKRATAISLPIALGIRCDGQKAVLAIRNMGGESEAAWRAVLEDMALRGLAEPELVIVDGGPRAPFGRSPGDRIDRAAADGLEAALAGLWGDVPAQRCTVPKARPRAGCAAGPGGARPPGPCAQAPTRGDQGRARRYGARQDGHRRPGQAQGLPRQVEAAPSRRRRQPRGGRRAPVHLTALPAGAVALAQDDERDRAPARGARAADQDPVPAARRRDRRHVALGASGLGPDHPAQGRRPAEPRPAPGRA
jgi:hypothetical protein